jgi:membrane fusion protein (multidrug efflux system)
MTRLRPVLLVLLGVLATLAVGLAAWSGGWLRVGAQDASAGSGAAPAIAGDPVPAADPTPTDPAGGTLAAGVPASAEAELQPARRARLALPVTGVVRELMVVEGDHVEAGTPLLRLDDARERARLAEVEADLAVADAQVDAARAGATAARRDVVVAETALVVADAQVDAAQASLRLTATQADATIAQADAALRQAEAGRAQAEAALAQARAAAAQADAQVASAQAQRSRVEAALASARLARSERELVAPFAGTIVAVDVEVGELLAEPALTLADTSAWYVRTTNLTELQVAAVETGEALDVAIDAVPGRTFRATVERVGARPEQVRGEVTYEVRLRLDPDDVDAATAELLRPGMTAVVRGL